jgi:hypothetical protein
MKINRVLLPGGLLFASVVLPVGIASADPVQQHCQARGTQQIDIIDGPISCDAAYQIVGGYNPQGEKYQEVQGFTCYTGNAMTRPIVLSCVSGNTDFAVNDVIPTQ